MPSKKMRVVVAGQMPPPIGGQNLNIKRVFELLQEEKDFEVDHLNFQFTPAWASARRVSFHKFFEVFKVWSRALKLRCHGVIDVMIYPAGGPHTVALLRDVILIPVLSVLSKRLVIHFRAAGLAETLEGRNVLLKWVCQLVYGSLAGEAVVLTEFGIRDAKAVGVDKIRVIPNAFEDQANGWKRKMKDLSDPVRFLSVGHLCADKGTPNLIKAFSSIAKTRPDIELVIVGECLPPYSQAMLDRDIAISGCSERISVKGVLRGEELSLEYKEADVFVFASVAPYESFGMVLIEAMQWSLPIVVTEWRGNTSVAGEHSYIAYGCEADLDSGLQEAMLLALNNRSKWPQDWDRNRSIYEKCYKIENLRENLRRLINE